MYASTDLNNAQRERLVDLTTLYDILGVQNVDHVGVSSECSQQGLDNKTALVKLQRDGMNVVTPPINLPSWMCCLLPCIKSMRFHFSPI